jgi:hypothetical protein
VPQEGVDAHQGVPRLGVPELSGGTQTKPDDLTLFDVHDKDDDLRILQDVGGAGGFAGPGM